MRLIKHPLSTKNGQPLMMRRLSSFFSAVLPVFAYYSSVKLFSGIFFVFLLSCDFHPSQPADRLLHLVLFSHSTHSGYSTGHPVSGQILAIHKSSFFFDAARQLSGNLFDTGNRGSVHIHQCNFYLQSWSPGFVK